MAARQGKNPICNKFFFMIYEITFINNPNQNFGSAFLFTQCLDINFLKGSQNTSTFAIYTYKIYLEFTHCHSLFIRK